MKKTKRKTKNIMQVSNLYQKIFNLLLVAIILCGYSFNALAQNPNLDSGLVAYYPFNGNANDMSGNGNHGIIKGVVRLTADRFGNPCNAYYFSGCSGNGYTVCGSYTFTDGRGLIEIDNSPILDALADGDYSYSFWATTTNQRFDVFCKSEWGRSGGAFRLQYNYWKTGEVSILHKDLHINFFYDLTNVTTNKWYFFVVVVKNDDVKCYINNNKLTKISSRRGDQVYNKNTKLYIGVDPHHPAGFIDDWHCGAIDDIRIYNRALSDLEIKMLYEEIPIPVVVNCTDGFELTLKPNTPAGGTTIGSDSYVFVPSCGQEVTATAIISATPNDCYIFLHWTDISGNILTHLKQKDTITIRSDSTIIAVFETTFFPITVDKNIPEAGTVIAEQYGCDNVIEAIPNDCYKFVHWIDSEKNIISTKQIDTLKLTSDSTLIAIFENYDFSVTVHTNIAEAGEVEKEEYDCDNAIISATPNECYRFVHWIDTDEKIISTKRIDTLKLTSDSTLIAIFENYDFSVTVHTNIAEAGEVEKEEDCDNAIISATPNDCYTFINWTDTAGKIISTQQIDTLKLFSDSTLIANFVLNDFELGVYLYPVEAGTVSGSGRYNCNDLAIYEAIPNDCYRFINWLDANSGEVVSTKLIDTILMIEDRKLIANFEFYNYNIVLYSEFYVDEKPLSAGYSHQLNHKTLPKLRFKFNSDIPTSELKNITELNVSFDYRNVFAHIVPNSLKLLDLPSNWAITNFNKNDNFETLISNYTVTLTNSAGLSSANLNLFEVDFQMALPNSDMVKGKIENEYYNLLISPVFLVQTANCIVIKTDTSQLNVAPICVIDYRILKFSDLDFALEIVDNVINYSIAFDCEASLTIYNSLGQAILIPVSGAITKGVYTLDISDITFPTGAYFCELRIDGVYRKVVGMIVAR